MKPEAYLILENIRSALNVGAIFRTAEAIGIAKIYLVGYTPAPIDRFGRKQPDVAKAALGAEAMVPWESVPSTDVLLEKLRSEGVQLVVVERTDGATDYKQCVCAPNVAFIFGNEVDGVSDTAQRVADEIVSLPMKGRKESLNVATTVGIVLYRLLDI